MATLPDADRGRICIGLMRYLSPRIANLPISGLLSTDIKAAVDAADSWVDSNSTSYNNALPQPFRNAAPTGLKSLLLIAVVLMRYNLALLKTIFGEVD